GAERLAGVDGAGELFGGPAGGGDDARVAQRDAFVAQRGGELHGPAARGGHAFADRVAVAQRQVTHARGGERGAHATAMRSSAAASARRASTRSMRANTSRSTGASGSSV